MPVLVGTSGWQYRDWRGRFYPPRLPQRRWLEHHAAAFATTEVNNSFYRLPDGAVFASWRERTPRDYVVTVKASRFLSHVKRLQEPAEPVARLMERVACLDDRLGAVLLQLPPTLPCDVELLDACLACFPTGTRVAVEPRHESWWNADLRDVLTSRGAALVWSDRGSQPVAEPGHPLDQPGHRLFGVAQPLDVGEETAGLDRPAEVRRGARPPRLERRPLGQPVEGVVALDRGEVRRVVLEPQPLGQSLRVEAAAPVPVLPARRPDDHRHGQPPTRPARCRRGPRCPRIGGIGSPSPRLPARPRPDDRLPHETGPRCVGTARLRSRR